MSAKDLKQITEVLQNEFAKFREENRTERRAELAAAFLEFAKENKKERRAELSAAFADFAKQNRKEWRAELAQFAVENRKERRAELAAAFLEFAKQNREERHMDLARFTEEVLLPAIETMIDNKLEEKLQPLILASKQAINESRFVTKDYCEGKRSDLRGDILAARKRDSARVDKHINIHQRKGNLTDKEVEELDKMRDFAPLPVKV